MPRWVWGLFAGAIVGMALVGFALGRAVTAGSGEPGSEADPLVSKSYVDQFVQLQVVELAAGQGLEVDAGTEIILRAGQATAMGSPLGGVADVTAGKDLPTGQAVSLNHLLVVPRSDGRGLRAVTDVVVVVRGPFRIRPQ